MCAEDYCGLSLLARKKGGEKSMSAYEYYGHDAVAGK